MLICCFQMRQSQEVLSHRAREIEACRNEKGGYESRLQQKEKECVSTRTDQLVVFKLS